MKFFKNNGLSIAFLLLALICLTAQILTGLNEYNDFRLEHSLDAVSLKSYLSSGHFLQATFENWESEFLQMALFVILTVYLRQKGSSESKPVDEPFCKKEDLEPKRDSPWPVKKGGTWLFLYKYSLSIALFLLFIVSFLLHWYGSWIDYIEKQTIQHQPVVDFMAYLHKSKLWFESFQNWQSEFLSIFTIIYMSVYLRHHGSAQSKPVNMANDENE